MPDPRPGPCSQASLLQHPACSAHAPLLSPLQFGASLMAGMRPHVQASDASASVVSAEGCIEKQQVRQETA